MKILYLTGENVVPLPVLDEHDVTRIADPISVEDVKGFDVGIALGYRHIVRAAVLDKLKIANAHPGYNGGAYPNIWDWLCGHHAVLLHWMSPKIDRGPVIYEKELSPPLAATLRTSYDRKMDRMVAVVYESWPAITGKWCGFEQDGSRPHHTVKDAKPYLDWLETKQGWDTPVMKFLERFQ